MLTKRLISIWHPPPNFTAVTHSQAGVYSGTTLFFQGVVQEYASELASFEFALQTDQDAQATVNLLPATTPSPQFHRETVAQASRSKTYVPGADRRKSLLCLRCEDETPSCSCPIRKLFQAGSSRPVGMRWPEAGLQFTPTSITNG